MNSTYAIISSLIMLLMIFSACSPELPSADSDHPLEECPDTPNCNRSQIQLEVSLSEAIEITGNVLEIMGAESVEQTDDASFHAVFRIPVFGWRDDMHVQVNENEDGNATVYVRSASRVGRSDYGVNARRIERFFVQVSK